jgi:uncharacterized membrane protein
MYNQGMSSLLLNRVLLVLGLCGIFVAAMLSIQHLFQLEIPCGRANDCMTVARHPSSYLGKYPVAFFGLFGYLALTSIVTLRLFTGMLTSKPLVAASYFMSGFGTLASLYLQYISFTQIQAKCMWCISSAVIMLATFIVNGLLFSKSDAQEVNSNDSKFSGLTLAVAIPLIAFSLIAFKTMGNKADLLITEVVVKVATDLIPDVRNQLGPNDAPITIVEFADFCCGGCRAAFPKLQELPTKNPGKVRVIYRHFPLFNAPGHQQAVRAAIISELAAEKNLFWQFGLTFVGPREPQQTEEEVYAAAQAVGLNIESVKKAIEDEASPQFARVARDQEVGKNVLNIQETPSYFVQVKGNPKVRKMNSVGLNEFLNSREAQDILNAK